LLASDGDQSLLSAWTDASAADGYLLDGEDLDGRDLDDELAGAARQFVG